MNPFFVTDFSISDSLKTVRKSVLIYETIIVAWQILNQRKQNKENVVMKELAKQFIGEECIIYTITSNDGSIQGVIKEIDDGGMVIERNSGEREIVNLDFVTRIRQYPRKKNGKKKDIVWD